MAALWLSAGCSFNGDVPSPNDNSGTDASMPPSPGNPDAAGGDGAPVDAGPSSGSPDAFTPEYSLAVNLAGLAHAGTDYPGNWLADDGSYCGGAVYGTIVGIHNTVDDPLFQTNRYGSYSCRIGEQALPSGDYSVTLLFGEVYRGLGCVNPASSSRIYDVTIEGVLVMDNFDPMAASGGCVASTVSSAPTPVSRSFVTTVSDGTLNIETSGQTNGMISALRIESAAPAD